MSTVLKSFGIAIIGFCCLINSVILRAGTIPILIDDISIFIPCPDIVGNAAGIAGVTVTASPGNYSIVSSVNGDYVISCLPANATYTVNASKVGVSFINLTQTVAIPANSFANVRADFYSYSQFQSQYVTQVVPNPLPYLSNFSATITLKNTGTVSWQPSQVFLKSEDLQYPNKWGNPTVSLPNVVNPGQNVTFAWTVVPDWICQFGIGCGIRGAKLFFQFRLNGPGGPFGATSLPVVIEMSLPTIIQSPKATEQQNIGLPPPPYTVPPMYPFPATL